jgi:hypothetical protein
MRVRRAGARQHRLIARSAGGRARRGELITTRLAIGEGEILELRP